MDRSSDSEMAEDLQNNKDKLDYDADIYSSYRKDTSEEIVSKIMSFLKEKYEGSLEVAVDVGCGNGQSTVVFAPFFKQVYGIDGIETQIQAAESSRKCSNITYKVGPAETLPFADNSVQLITAATALHWFDLDIFFPEARRILSNNGTLAVYGYTSMKPLLKTPSLCKDIDELYDEYYRALNPYFLPQVQIMVQKYKNIHFPFEEVIRIPDIKCEFKGCLSDIVGYVETYSGLKTCKEQNPAEASNILNTFQKRLYEIASKENLSSNETITLYRDYILILCRKQV